MEQIFKLQPDRCLALRGFDSFAAAAALHSATPNSFQVSGTFRDQADFAVLVLWDADNYFEHPSQKYLPDFNFTGLVLTFDLAYTDGVQPIDSPKYNWIDWATLDCVLASDTVASPQRPRIPLWDHATLAAGTFTPASASFTLMAGANGPQPGDTLSLWFENVAFGYTVPVNTNAVEFSFFVKGNGTVHSVTVSGRVYSMTEMGSTGASIVAALIAAVNASGGDPDVVAMAGSAANAIRLNYNVKTAKMSIALAASDGNAPVTMPVMTPAGVAQQMAALVNAAPGPWQNSGGGLAIVAASAGAVLTLEAARYGVVNTTGTTVNWVAASGSFNWSDKFPGLAPGNVIFVNGEPLTVASVVSPTQLTVTAAPSQNHVNAPYVAPRGGRDGNLCSVYWIAEAGTAGAPVNLQPDALVRALTGGTSAVTWSVSLDFTALGIDQLRQCWLTFAPSLTNGAASTPVNWLAAFSGWTMTGGANRLVKVAGPGSVRIEETSTFCRYSGSGWSAPPGDVTGGFYSKYAALVSKNAGDAVTVTYACGAVHNLYIGTSLYVDRGTASVVLDGTAQADLNCALNEDAAVVSRRLLSAGVAAGSHTVTITSKGTGPVYFDFLEAAVLSDWSAAARTFAHLSPALDYDTDHTYKLSPARILWMFRQLGFGGPINEYMGVFWWNQRTAQGGVNEQAQAVFGGTFAAGDALFLTINGGFTLGKTVVAGDTTATIAAHFAYYLNATSTSAWARASGGTLTITSRSASPAYALTVAATPAPALGAGSNGTVKVTTIQATATYPTWVVDPTIQPVLNQAITDWHTDFYTLCAAANLEVTTAGSMELVLPPAGFASEFTDGSAVTTATDVATAVGLLTSTQCAVGGSLLKAYQTQFYLAVAALQKAAGLVPSVQFGEFLWWYFPMPAPSLDLAYYAAGNGTRHILTVNGKVYAHTENSATGESSADVANAIIALVNAGAGDPYVVAGVGPATYEVQVTPRNPSAAAIAITADAGSFSITYAGGMAYYDPETKAAAQAQLGRPLQLFLTQNDDPTVNGSADATFLRNRLRDHVGALGGALRAAYSNVKIEVLFPYDVNYPEPVAPGNALGGRLNAFVNLPVEWKQPGTSGLDRIKVEALQFGTAFRSMDLASQAIGLMPGYGWPRGSVRYLVPVFGTFTPWMTEVGLAFGQNLNAVNLWAFDQMCLYNLDLTNLREP